MSVDVGTIAPDFTLMDQDRTPVTLSELRGKTVVLAFFPAAFTPVCTTELCTFRDWLSKLSEADATVLGISIDTPFSLKIFREQQGLNFPLLSDFNKTTIQLYDVVYPDLIGLKDVAKRAVFVLDRDGTIRHKEVLDSPGHEPNYDDVFKAVSAFA